MPLIPTRKCRCGYPILNEDACPECGGRDFFSIQHPPKRSFFSFKHAKGRIFWYLTISFLGAYFTVYCWARHHDIFYGEVQTFVPYVGTPSGKYEIRPIGGMATSSPQIDRELSDKLWPFYFWVAWTEELIREYPKSIITIFIVLLFLTAGYVIVRKFAFHQTE